MAGNIPIGISFPQTEIGTDPDAMRDFAQAVEALGFSHLTVIDHVIGADLTHRPDWNKPYDLDNMFQEPITLLAFLAAHTKRLRLTTGVIILPQRQTVLFGKQAATLDILSRGRLRLGVGLGWNKIEYAAMGYGFAGRAKRMDEQIGLLRRLWTERSFSDGGELHDIVDAGIYPLPQRAIPIWIGGYSDAAMKRAARIGDGWLPFLPAKAAKETVAAFREAVVQAGRNPAAIGIENIILGRHPYADSARTIADIGAEIEMWRGAGVDGLTIDTMRMGASGADAHIVIARQIADATGLRPSAT